MKKELYLCLFLVLMGMPVPFAQTTDVADIVKIDSIDQQKDLKFYKKIQNFFKKNQITKNLSSSLFTSTLKSSTSSSIRKELNLNYAPFQGKIIRNIEINTLDPFGFDEKNLSVKPTKKIDIYGNALHNKTSRRTIKRQLLFKENTLMDSMLLKESERVLRNRNYIRRVVIRPMEIAPKSDSIDIQVNVLDSWTMYFTSDLTDKRGWLRISEQNLFGLGHEASVLYRQYFKKFKDNGKGFYYRAKNLGNTQIDAVTSYYVDDYENEFLKRIAVERPLFSPYARWTGRIGFYENQYKEDIFSSDSLHFPFIKTQIYDLYGGYVIPLKKKHSVNINNMILSLRYKHTHFLRKPDDFLNIDNYYSNQTLLLSKFSLNSTNFVQDKYIFRQGDVEDVNVGHSLFLISGILQKNRRILPYFGAGFSYANYRKRGYFSFNFEAGSLFDDNRLKQVTLRGESIYFSNLFTLGNWHFRQFFKTIFVIGENRSPHIKDRVSINGRDGIFGFYSNIFGTRKLIYSTQTQAYSPFYWLGFRFNPFFNIDVGFIGLEKKPFFNTEFFSKVALGFYIANDYLMFQNFQFSLCYYPRIPSVGEHIVKITNLQNDDFRLQSFQHKLPDMLNYK